jgi:hypothetical protein
VTLTGRSRPDARTVLADTATVNRSPDAGHAPKAGTARPLRSQTDAAEFADCGAAVEIKKFPDVHDVDR